MLFEICLATENPQLFSKFKTIYFHNSLRFDSLEKIRNSFLNSQLFIFQNSLRFDSLEKNPQLHFSNNMRKRGFVCEQS